MSTGLKVWGWTMLLWNVGTHLPEITASYGLDSHCCENIRQYSRFPDQYSKHAAAVITCRGDQRTVDCDRMSVCEPNLLVLEHSLIAIAYCERPGSISLLCMGNLIGLRCACMCYRTVHLIVLPTVPDCDLPDNEITFTAGNPVTISFARPRNPHHIRLSSSSA